MTRFRDVVPSVRHHHENWDGTGYPDGLAGDAIPLAARIIRFADTIDAMTTERPYRGPLTEAQVRSEVMRCRGTQFDPEMADRLLASPLWPSLFAPESNDRKHRAAVGRRPNPSVTHGRRLSRAPDRRFRFITGRTDASASECRPCWSWLPSPLHSDAQLWLKCNSRHGVLSSTWREVPHGSASQRCRARDDALAHQHGSIIPDAPNRSCWTKSVDGILEVSMGLCLQRCQLEDSQSDSSSRCKSWKPLLSGHRVTRPDRTYSSRIWRASVRRPISIRPSTRRRDLPSRCTASVCGVLAPPGSETRSPRRMSL